jgi:hypothetical protein
MDSRPLLQNEQAQVEKQPRDIEYVATLRSDWVDESNCCCRIAYFPVGDFRICGHWRTSIKIPITVCIVFIASLLIFIIDTSGIAYSKYKYPSTHIMIISYSAIGFAFLMSIISYFQILIRGPGYVPYNWCLTRQMEYDFETMMSSVAVYQEQVDFGRTHERPDRASFSIDARRYVLRADHFCDWTQCWIGQKNIRYFILLTGWVSLYCLLYIGLRYFWAYDVITSAIRTKKFDYFSIIGWVCVLLSLGIFIFAVRLFITALHNLSLNVTLIEKWKMKKAKQPVRSPTPKRSCLQNYEEICGSRRMICCWPLPFICTTPHDVDSDADSTISVYTDPSFTKSPGFIQF